MEEWIQKSETNTFRIQIIWSVPLIWWLFSIIKKNIENRTLQSVEKNSRINKILELIREFTFIRNVNPKKCFSNFKNEFLSQFSRLTRWLPRHPNSDDAYLTTYEESS